MKKVLLLFLLLFVVGCSKIDWKYANTQTFKFERIFMNNPSNYLVYYKNKDNELVPYTLNIHAKDCKNDWGKIKIIGDVKPEDSKWVSIKTFVNPDDSSDIRKEIDIHLHDASELNGGQWTEQRGKTKVSGPVQVVE